MWYVGGVGTGKTHLSIALGMACCQHNYRVRFVTAAELVTLLVEAQQQGRLARKLDQLARFDVIICDELGYVPLDKAGADLLFGFISQRYERRSLVVTTNLPFARWSEVFLDPTAAAAVIDRIIHGIVPFAVELRVTDSQSPLRSHLYYATSATAPSGGASASSAPTRCCRSR